MRYHVATVLANNGGITLTNYDDLRLAKLEAQTNGEAFESRGMGFHIAVIDKAGTSGAEVELELFTPGACLNPGKLILWEEALARGKRLVTPRNEGT